MHKTGSNCEDRDTDFIEKQLSYTEKRRHWLRIPSKFRKLLLEGVDVSSGGIDLVAFYNEKTKTVTLDRENRLLLGSVLFDELEIDAPGSVVIRLEKIQNGQFRISKKR